MATNTQKAINRIKDRMRAGHKLMRSNTVHGPRWFVVGFGEISDHLARLVIADIEAHGSKDSIWPGLDQTWGVR